MFAVVVYPNLRQKRLHTCRITKKLLVTEEMCSRLQHFHKEVESASYPFHQVCG